MSDKRLKPLLSRFKVKAHHYELYLAAFTHPSVNLGEHKVEDYQRLEYVGDSVLGASIATLSYKLRKDLHEGELTRLRSSLVDTNGLSRLAYQYEFAKYIKVGPSFKTDLNKSPKILEDVFEAFIGAIYLDRGFDYTFKVVERIFKDKIIHFNYEASVDYKTKIQELCQADHHTDLSYRVMSKHGPANNPSFKVGLYYDGVCLGYGFGGSKKKAEQAAAKAALNKLAKGK
ncbi:MAG: ribonuclease III [Bacilli bacterium]|nr:ribonuclease III [Bacilli bacterium]